MTRGSKRVMFQTRDGVKSEAGFSNVCENFPTSTGRGVTLSQWRDDSQMKLYVRRTLVDRKTGRAILSRIYERYDGITSTVFPVVYKEVRK